MVNKTYTLYNKNTPIVDVTFDVRRQEIEDIVAIHNPEYAPLGIAVDNRYDFRDNLSDWWESRSVSDSRKHVHWMLSMLQETKQRFMIRSMGLSLSDQYWIKEKGSSVQWKDVNFFTNPFSPVVGEMFFESANPSGNIEDYTSPEWTLNGSLEKCWRIQTGERILCKKGSVIPQQPYNEKIASEILKSIGCEHYVKYEVGGTLEHPYSVCRNFVTKDTEYIPATSLKKRFRKDFDTDMYQHFMRCCETLGVAEEMQRYLDYAIPFDYMIANVDRNMGNFGLIRNVETLKIVGAAPLFDHGNSLWYDSILPEKQEERSYPFRFKQEEQLPYVVSDRDVFPIGRIRNIEDIVSAILKENPLCCISGRDEKIVALLTERVKRLEDFLGKSRKARSSVIEHDNIKPKAKKVVKSVRAVKSKGKPRT